MTRFEALWPATAPPAEAIHPFEGQADTEVAIIGAGLSGLSTAYHLAVAGRAATVLEAAEIGAGGSGRSGGQVIPGLRHHVSDLVKVYGGDLGRRLHTFGSEAADRTFGLIDRLQIACDVERAGWIQAADTETALAEARARAKAWQSLGAPVDALSREEIVGATGTTAYLGGFIDRRGGAVNPMALTRGLAGAARRAGAILHTGSPVRALARDGAGWRLETGRGVLTAKRVLVACNLGALRLVPDAGRAQLGVWSAQIATAPLSPDQRRRILPTGTIVSDTRRVLRYFRLDPAGRLVVGGKGKSGPPRRHADIALQRHILTRLYPELAAIPLDFAWAGEIGITLDRLPRLFTLGEGVWAVLQDNGKGIAWNIASGEPLAHLLMGEDSRALPLVPVTPPRPIPFHRFRAVYVAAGNRWLRFRDRVEGARG